MKRNSIGGAFTRASSNAGRAMHWQNMVLFTRR